MIIGFIGDVHGAVYHALALAATWQFNTGERFDHLIQVGDMAAYPDLDRADAATKRYVTVDPAQADFSRLLKAKGKRARGLTKLRNELLPPIHFVRGNHEDFDFLKQLHVDESIGSAQVDPFDLIRYVPDGSVLRLGGLSVAFLGGIEIESRDDRAIDAAAYDALMGLGTGTIDVLVTHDVPYGTRLGYRENTWGSKLIKALIEETQPTFHVASHVHHVSGPRRRGQTTSWTLSGLVASARWYPELNGFELGCLAVLDTDTGTLRPITDEWMAEFDTKSFDFDSWFEDFIS